jgi:hypothetical protein
MSEAIPPFPYMPSWHAQGQLYLLLSFVTHICTVLSHIILKSIQYLQQKEVIMYSRGIWFDSCQMLVILTDFCGLSEITNTKMNDCADKTVDGRKLERMRWSNL